MQNNHIQDIIIEKSKELGFDLIGFSSASGINTKIDQWIELGFHASMNWMKSSMNQRREVLKYFPKAKTVISFGYNYFTQSNRGNKNYKISKYAWGNDYHIVLKEKLYEIIKTISLHNKNFEYRVCVDTSPLMEKHWGQKAGLGWIGKHTNLINSKIGTWFFLSEIIIDFELEFNKPFTYDLCGSCTKCIDACPTEALEDYVLDANDTFISMVEFENGAIGTVNATRFATGYKNRLELRIFGDKGAVKIEFDDAIAEGNKFMFTKDTHCLLYTSPSPRD